MSLSARALLLALLACAAPLAAQIPLVGVWVQDDTGPVLVYGRRYEFKSDGSYQFTFTSRPRGSAQEKLLASEVGRFKVQGARLVLTPKGGKPRTLEWKVDKDPYVGDTRLVFPRADGGLDIYYREGR